VLSGYVNGLFLVVIAFSIMKEALTRILEPPHVHTDQLMGVSVAGLVVNLVCIWSDYCPFFVFIFSLIFV
jgi:zinc transporter 5/7